MTNREKHACFNLIVTGVALATFTVMLRQHGVGEAFAAFTLLALWGLGPIVFLSGQSSGNRSGRLIHRRASKHGLGAALIGVGFTSVAMAVGGFLPHLWQATLAVGTSAWIVFIIVHGVSTLAQHHQRRQVA